MRTHSRHVESNHTGRIRISFPELYRSDAEKIKIESNLSSRKHVIAVYANPLTSRVLILFDSPMALEEMLSVLGMEARPANITTRKARNTAPAIRPPANETPTRPDHEIYPPWHLRDASAALAFYQSSLETGLSSSVVLERLNHGLNLLPQTPVRSSWEMLLDQFKSLPVLLLGASAVVSFLTASFFEAIAVIAVLVTNAGIGYVTERRAESQIAPLSELTDNTVPALREGKIVHVAASHVAPGDILILAAGARLPADVRLLRSNGLSVDESALTGESMPVAKNADALGAPVPLADRANMAYRGTAVTTGSAHAIVVGTGSNTEIGAIQSLMVATQRPKTPIQRQLDQLGNQLVKASGLVCIGVFGIGLLRRYGWLHMLKVSTSLAIAAIPEGLPAVATTSLARGIRLMRDRNVLIRRLQSVETIGAIQTICLDKTGTLTLNRMSAVEVRAGHRCYKEIDSLLTEAGKAGAESSSPELLRLLQIGVLCSETEFAGADQSSSRNGSSTERALIDLATKTGIRAEQLRARHPLVTMEPRAEGRNYMTTMHATPGSSRLLIAVKGSPAEVLGLCSRVQQDGQLIDMSAEAKAAILRENEDMAARQLRVLGFAYAESDATRGAPATGQLAWIGLVGLADPLRAGVKDLIESFHHAGIRTVMVTGDQSATAFAIGEALALNNGATLHVLGSEQMAGMDEDTLRAAGETVDIFARVSPSYKLQIVRALQSGGRTIAMTGDGINDGPALQAADVGIAMGHGGTDLARSAADVILKEDKLETVLEAVRQGRTIATNIRKSLHFLLSSNLSEILVVLGGISMGAGSPLTPMQLLWLNLLTDVLPGIALAAEPPEHDVMTLPPRDSSVPIIGGAELRRYAREAVMLAGGALGAYAFGASRYGPGGRAGGIAFNTLILGQLLHAWSCRSDRPGVFGSGSGGRNPQLDLSIGISIALQLLANIVPGLRGLLGGAPIGGGDIFAIAAGAGIPVLVNEAAKAKRLPAQTRIAR